MAQSLLTSPPDSGLQLQRHQSKIRRLESQVSVQVRTTEKFRDKFAQHKEDAQYYRSVASELTEHVEELTGEEGGAQKYAELKHNLAMAQQATVLIYL